MLTGLPASSPVAQLAASRRRKVIPVDDALDVLGPARELQIHRRISVYDDCRAV